MPAEKRLRGTTTNAVRLSLSFLRPWLHRVSPNDVETAQAALASLAIVVSRWPGQLWVSDHSEVAGLSKAMVEIVLEEMRESQRTQKAVDAEKMQGIVDQIRRLTIECEKEVSRRRLLEAISPSTVFSVPVDEEEEVTKEVETAVPHSPSSHRFTKANQQALIARVAVSTWFTGLVFGSLSRVCSHTREGSSCIAHRLAQCFLFCLFWVAQVLAGPSLTVARVVINYHSVVSVPSCFLLFSNIVVDCIF